MKYSTGDPFMHDTVKRARLIHHDITAGKRIGELGAPAQHNAIQEQRYERYVMTSGRNDS